MKRSLIVFLVVLALVAPQESFAQGPFAQVLSLTRIPPSSVVVEIAILEGILTAAQRGNADFELSIDFSYQSSGLPVTDSATVLVRDTVLLGNVDNRLVLVRALIPLSSPPDQDTPIETSVELGVRH